MPPRKPKAGDVYRYVGTTPLGIDAGALLPGTEVTVREVVEAGTPGAHDNTEDAVVVEWEAPGTVTTEVREEPYERPEVVRDAQGNARLAADGTPEVRMVERRRAVPVLGYGTVSRAMSIGLEGRDYTGPDGAPATFPPFRDLFEEA